MAQATVTTTPTSIIQFKGSLIQNLGPNVLYLDDGNGTMTQDNSIRVDVGKSVAIQSNATGLRAMTSNGVCDIRSLAACIGMF